MFAYVKYRAQCPRQAEKKIVPVSEIRNFDSQNIAKRNKSFNNKCGESYCAAIIIFTGETEQALDEKITGKRLIIPPSDLIESASDLDIPVSGGKTVTEKAEDNPTEDDNELNDPMEDDNEVEYDREELHDGADNSSQVDNEAKHGKVDDDSQSLQADCEEEDDSTKQNDCDLNVLEKSDSLLIDQEVDNEPEMESDELLPEIENSETEKPPLDGESAQSEPDEAEEEHGKITHRFAGTEKRKKEVMETKETEEGEEDE